jgi:hypothetical protein
MMNTKDIDELRAASDAVELAYQQTLQARKAAVADSSAVLKAARKARARFLRACGAHGEGK